MRFLALKFIVLLVNSLSVSYAENVPLIRASEDRIALIDWLAKYQMECSSLFEISASSHLPPIGEISYEVSNLVDSLSSTAWVEGVSGLGKGEEILYKIKEPTTDNESKKFDGEFLVINGLARNPETWEKNARVKQIACFYNGEHIFTVELQDIMNPQLFSLRDVDAFANRIFKAGDRISFLLWKMYPGSKYEDTCLSALIPLSQ
ncbi:MAG: hypothetical protein AAGA18_15550 [Verrucomicrobiota bacterium]